MSSCALCGREKQTGEQTVIYTGAVLNRDVQTAGNVTQTTTTYGNFCEHYYFVCRTCTRLWNSIMAVAVVIYLAIIVVSFVLSIRLENPYWFVFGLFFVIFGVGPLSNINIGAKLKRKALGERGERPKGLDSFMFTGITESYKAFNEEAYLKAREIAGL